MVFNSAIVAAGTAGVNVNQLGIMGVGSVVVILIIAAVGMFGNNYVATQSIANATQQGIQGVTSVNTVRTIDNAQDDGANVASNSGE